MVKPFKVNISNQTIEDIYIKVKKYPWEKIPNINGWVQGTNFSYIKEIANYWVKEFNWKSMKLR